MPSFRLVSFPDGPAGVGCAVAGAVERAARELHATFRVTVLPDALAGDSPRALIVPPRSPAPARRDGLWQSTCLELFVGVPGEPGYLEVNVAPSGDWNVYRFTGYREGMVPLDPPEPRSREAPRGPGEALAIGFTLVLPEPWVSARGLEAGVSAVLEWAGGEKTYWAITHRGPRPDFHRRDAFVLDLGERPSPA